MTEKKDLSQFQYGTFLINLLGIIYDPKTKKILIGKRKNDKHLKKLTWCFPGGRPKYQEELEHYLKHEIKLKTNLDTKITKIIYAKTYPEKREFLSIYYHCEITSNSEKEKAGNKFTKIKWIKPTEIKNYFKTSLHPKIEEYLKKLK